MSPRFRLDFKGTLTGDIAYNLNQKKTKEHSFPFISSKPVAIYAL